MACKDGESYGAECVASDGGGAVEIQAHQPLQKSMLSTVSSRCLLSIQTGQSPRQAERALHLDRSIGNGFGRYHRWIDRDGQLTTWGLDHRHHRLRLVRQVFPLGEMN